MNTVEEPSDSDLLRRVWNVMIARSWWVIGIVAAFTLAGFAAAYLMRPVYRLSTTLIPAESADSPGGLGAVLDDLGGLAALAGVNLDKRDDTVEAVAILRSRQFTESFIRDENLLKQLFAKRWDAKRDMWAVPPHKVPTLYEAYRKFDRKIRRVVEDKKTGLVKLEIEWYDAKEGARWANEIVRRLNELMRKKAISEVDASVQFLDDELRATNVVSVQQAISRAIESQVKRRTLASTRPEYVFRTVDPAAAPDPDYFVRPKRALYVVAGPMVGLLFAVFAILSWNFLARQVGRRTRQTNAREVGIA